MAAKLYEPILLPWHPREVRTRSYRVKIYQAILDYCAEHTGNTPTIRELCEICQISSTSVVNFHIQKLIDEGWLDWVDRKLIVVGSVWIPPTQTDR